MKYKVITPIIIVLLFSQPTFQLNFKFLDRLNNDRHPSCVPEEHITYPDEFIVGKHGESYPGYTQISSKFVKSTVARAFLDKFARDHSQYFGFRAHKSTFCNTCTRDNLGLATSDHPVLYMIPSKSSGEPHNCNKDIVNYRPKMCLGTNCNLDWNKLIISQVRQSSGKLCEGYDFHGIYMKTEKYNYLFHHCIE
jgi:hypothetical protein